LARAQGWVYPYVLMHVSCARLSPCGWTCVSGCGHVCVCPSSLFCCPPAVFGSRWKGFPFFMGPHVCRPGSVSARQTMVCVLRFLVRPVFFSTSWLLVIVAFPLCPGLPTVALWISWPVLLRFCVGHSSSPPQCVPHPLLSVSHFARCLSPALLLGASCSSSLVPCRCFAPARHVGLSRFVSAWPCLVKPFSSIKKNQAFVAPTMEPS
jgi:hypothetical protein